MVGTHHFKETTIIFRLDHVFCSLPLDNFVLYFAMQAVHHLTVQCLAIHQDVNVVIVIVIRISERTSWGLLAFLNVAVKL